MRLVVDGCEGWAGGLEVRVAVFEEAIVTFEAIRKMKKGGAKWIP